MNGKCVYASENYSVPADIGRKVIAYGKTGVIAEDRGNHIGILLDSDKAGNIGSYHPIDGIEYLSEFGRIRKTTRSQKRYSRYLEYGDMFDTFLDFCYWDASLKHR